MFWRWVLPNKDTYFSSFSFVFIHSICILHPMLLLLLLLCICVHTIPEFVHIFAVFSCIAAHLHVRQSVRCIRAIYTITISTITKTMKQQQRRRRCFSKKRKMENNTSEGESEREKKKKFPHKLENTRLCTKTEYKMYIVCSFVLCLCVVCISSLSVLSVLMHIIAAAITVAVCTYCSALHFHRMHEYLYRPWHCMQHQTQNNEQKNTQQ